MRKELTGVVQGVSGRRRLLLRFQNGCENNLSLNQLTVVTAHEILVEEAPEVSTIPEIPEVNVESQKGYYVCVYVLLQLKTEEKLTIRRSRRNLRMILMKRISIELISMTRGSVTGEMFSRTMKEVWMRRHYYMPSVGIYISTRRKNL